MPQLRFNEDGQWHDFAPKGGAGLKAGPWFPYLELYPGDRLSNHRVNRPRPVKGAAAAKSSEPEDESASIPLLCANCLSAAPAGSKYKKCGGCQCVFYCGATCQKAHWKSHKKECAEMARKDLASMLRPD